MGAFEQGTLDAEICGQRIRDLRIRLEQLTHRRGDLEHLLAAAPGRPNTKALDERRSNLIHVFRHGTNGQRKAVIEGQPGRDQV